MALTPPPNSNIPTWAAAGNNPYNIPALGQAYSVFNQDPGFFMRNFQNLPGMQNLFMSAINGGGLGRNWAANPAMQDYRNLDAYYAGGNGNRPGGFLEGLGADQMNPTGNLAGGWTVAPGGMKNMNAISQWAQAVNAAAYAKNQAQYNQLMGSAPTGVKLINFNGSQLGLPNTAPNTTNPVNGQTPAGTNATPGTVGATANPYGAGYTGYGNTHISSGPTPSTGAGVTNTNPTGAGPQGQAPGTAGSFVAGPPTVTAPNTNTSAIPRTLPPNPAVGMPGVGLNGLPNNSGTTPNRNTLPVVPAPRVSGNYNMAINQNQAMNRY